MYAVNIGDWTAHKDDIGIQIILSPIVRQDGERIDAEPGRFDGMALALTCDDNRGAAVVELVRKRYKKYQFRFYHRKKSRWIRV